ncbi:hypothetical protein MES5069_480057 [Mesorhizobium escarrei]|uniref:Uncharacterized protein n=1 Tax=Mesorhizobium escarrei TaxID=666018 RepID=A0ABM9EA34_9HYPH|nr:hypothetical protein MES5069_480057 [Mesorhizobium escarrei]
MGPPPRSFATDAHAASWFRSTGDLPHTSLPRDLRAWLGELASESIVGFLAPCKKGGSPDPDKACRRCS